MGSDARMHQALWGRIDLIGPSMPPNNLQGAGAGRADHQAVHGQTDQTIAREGRVDPAASLSGPVCIFLPTDRGCQPAPDLPAPSSMKEGQGIKQTSGKTCRGNAKARSLFDIMNWNACSRQKPGMP